MKVSDINLVTGVGEEHSMERERAYAKVLGWEQTACKVSKAGSKESGNHEVQ